MRTKLYNFMVSVWNRIKGFKSMFQKVKQHPTLKKTPTGRIAPTYQQVVDDKQLAKDFNKAKAATPIDKDWLKCGKIKGGVVKFAYHFTFDFPSGSKSGKSGRQSVHQSIDVPIGSTKAEISAAIREQIRDWLESNYQQSGNGASRLTFGVDLIVAC